MPLWWLSCQPKTAGLGSIGRFSPCWQEARIGEGWKVKAVLSRGFKADSSDENHLPYETPFGVKPHPQAGSQTHCISPPQLCLSHPKSPLLPSNRVRVNEPHQGWEDEIWPERKIPAAFYPVLRGYWVCTHVAKFDPLGCAWLRGKIRRGGDIHGSELWSCCGTEAITVIKNIYS